MIHRTTKGPRLLLGVCLVPRPKHTKEGRSGHKATYQLSSEQVKDPSAHTPDCTTTSSIIMHPSFPSSTHCLSGHPSHQASVMHLHGSIYQVITFLPSTTSKWYMYMRLNNKQHTHSFNYVSTIYPIICTTSYTCLYGR